MKNLGLTQIRKGVDEYNLLKAEEMKRKLHHAYGELHTFKNEWHIWTYIILHIIVTLMI